MSELAASEGLAAPAAPPAERGLRGRQLWGILRIELRRNLLGRRSLALLFLAGMPVVVAAIWALWESRRGFSGGHGPLGADEAAIFAGLFEAYLRVPLFLGVLLVFMSLFRSELLERSLHYYLLTPVRRDILVAGKYLAALAVTSVVYSAATTALFLLYRWGVGGPGAFLTRGPGLGQLAGYLGVTLLACLGYGAVFLLAGLFFKNPVVPAVAIWAWEAIHPYLGAVLKRIGVLHYLRSLYPVPLPAGGPFEVIATPTPAWLSVPGLLALSAAVLAIAAWRLRRLEVSYADD